MRSSVMPSVKYSCSASPLMFANGNTAIDGLCGGAGDPTGADTATARSGVVMRKTRTGLAMFLSGFSPKSSSVISA